jgi:hypothetical protein
MRKGSFGQNHPFPYNRRFGQELPSKMGKLTSTKYDIINKLYSEVKTDLMGA